jgi:hypothetical protein
MVQVSTNFKMNDFILRTDTAIIVTSHPGHRMFLEATLSRYMRTGKYVICSYDSHNQWPYLNILNIPHTWISKPVTYGAEKRIGWLYDVLLAGGIIRALPNIQAVIITNGECIWELPENVDLLKKYVNERGGAMMCVTADSTLHTAAMIMKGWAFQAFVDFIYFTLSHNIPESYSPEVLLRQFVESRDIKNVVPELQPVFPEGHRYAGKIDHYASYNQPQHTWKQLVGFRNLGGEHKAACYEHLEPVDSKYIYRGYPPIYFDAHEARTLDAYMRSGDRRYLYQYWDQGEESSFNRRYYDIEHYGPSPLYDDSRRKELGPMTERMGVFDRFKTGSYVLKDEEFEKRYKEWIQKHYPELLKED